MPTASARGAALTDCQYVAIAGIWVQAWPPLTLFFLFLGQGKSRTAPQVPGYVVRNGLADRSDPGATAVAADYRICYDVSLMRISPAATAASGSTLRVTELLASICRSAQEHFPTLCACHAKCASRSYTQSDTQ
jgi:hypothetical protein